MAAAEAAPDLISNQPDAVLGTIVSLLPTKDGCRTQALSRRWRDIWRTAPLNLAAGRGRGGRLPEKYVNEILSRHLGPVRRISITGIGPLSYRTGREVVDEAGDARVHGWLGSPDVLASIEVLDISYYSYYGEVLPPSVFRFAPELREASFCRCRLPANLVVDFPSLEKLSLYNVTLTKEALRAVLSGCPTLRSLLLEKTACSDDCLRISSPALRSIGFFYAPSSSQELVIEDAPFLERLLLLEDAYLCCP